MTRRFSIIVSLALGLAALSAAQAFREKVRVGLVSVRLDVRGNDGAPVDDLKPSEVHLRVDGKDVPIEGLDRLAGAVAAPAASPASAEPSAAKAEAPGVLAA